MASPQPIIGRTLGHYCVLEQIGAGGMGVVYRARDEHLDRDVAFKVLPPGTFDDDAARRRFRQEALTLSKLNHPNIATIHDFDTQEGIDFLVIEHISGVTLDDMLRSAPLSEKEVLHLGQQLAEGVAAAHQQGVLHRDLKPGNVRLTPDRRLKILDFGLAKTIQPAGATAELTQSRAFAGTLPYMAPEQLSGGQADERTDIWAIGVVLYEMATGRRPFDRPTPPGIVAAILADQPIAPTSMSSRASPGLEQIILKCLDKESENRYQSATEIAVDLRRLSSRTADTPSVPPPASARWSPARLGFLSAGVAAILIVAAGLIWTLGGMRDRSIGHPTPRIESIAVLPLANLTGQADQEYFSDGMTDALITELAQIQELTVISRTSVMQYKGARKPMSQIAKELKVDAVVEGSVERSGDRVGINVQLIHAPTDRHLWASSFDRDLRDVIALQREIARTIASEIKVKLRPPEQARLAGARPVNAAAYEAYLKGFHHARFQTRDGLEKGMAYFRQALAIDPGYAPGYAGLAYCYVGLGDWYIPNKEVFPLAKEAASKALAIDDSVAEAHTFLATAKVIYDYDWAGAKHEFLRAIELSPGSPDAHRWYGLYHEALGESEAGLQEIRRALELDPLSSEGNHFLGMHFYYSRRYDAAIEQLRRTLDLDPKYFWSEMVLGQAYEQKGQFRDATAAYQRARQSTAATGEAPPEILASLARTNALSGRRVEALAMFGQLKALMKRRYVSSHDVATVWMALGDKQQALDWLEKAREDRNWYMPWVKVEPRFASLRSDPRFQAMLRRMKFPD